MRRYDCPPKGRNPRQCVACGGRFIPWRRKLYCSDACLRAPEPAVYRFVCPDGRSYVGSRADCRRRERQGIQPGNKRLAEALAIYPANTWTFELLQTLPAACLDEIRLRAEQHHIDRLRSWDPAHGFNLDPADCNAASFGCKEAYLWDRRRAIAQMAELTKTRSTSARPNAAPPWQRKRENSRRTRPNMFRSARKRRQAISLLDEMS
jgi:hypothetical protein